MFDHDLGFHDVLRPDDPGSLADVLQPRERTEETVFDLVCWMVATGRVPATVTIHSGEPGRGCAMSGQTIGSLHDRVAEMVNHGCDGECATEPVVDLLGVRTYRSKNVSSSWPKTSSKTASKSSVVTFESS